VVEVNPGLAAEILAGRPSASASTPPRWASSTPSPGQLSRTRPDPHEVSRLRGRLHARQDRHHHPRRRTPHRGPPAWTRSNSHTPIGASPFHPHRAGSCSRAATS